MSIAKKIKYKVVLDLGCGTGKFIKKFYKEALKYYGLDLSNEQLKIAKNKEGEAGGITYLAFDGAHQRFKESLTQPNNPKPKTEPEYQQTTFEELPGSDSELPF